MSRSWGAIHPAERITLASLGLFGLSGFGIARLALPARLRGHELLWILPCGACASALLLTALGFAAVPFKVSLGVVIALGALVDIYALRSRGLSFRGSSVSGLGWAVYVAALIAFVALIPLLRANFATVIGEGSDAHLAVGTAQFLQHHYPTSFHTDSVINQVPLVWRSKTPIYYVLAAAATLGHVQPYEAISTLQAVLLGLMLLGWFMFAREVLGSSAWAAAVAAGLVGLDRMVLHTVVHPYYNQTWGMVTIPYALTLAWLCFGSPRVRVRAVLGLFALFLALCAFAYPLAAPIPVLALLVFLWRQRRDRRSRLEPVREWRWQRLYRGRRSLVWLVPLGLVLLVPLVGVLEKLSSGYNVVLNPSQSLKGWGGDLGSYFPEEQFFGLTSGALLAVGLPLMLVAAWRALRERPRDLRWGLAAVFALGLLATIYFRVRPHGYYFHFKLLAFTAPLLVAVAAVGLSRIRILGPLLLIPWVLLAFDGARSEITRTPYEIPPTMIQLQGLNHAIPAGKSVRLDMDPDLQSWVAEMLYQHPLCSQTPLLDTSYPHVPISNRADYILVDYQLQAPFDSQGAPLYSNSQFRLYRAKPGTPGPDTCSQKRVATITSISGS